MFLAWLTTGTSSRGGSDRFFQNAESGPVFLVGTRVVEIDLRGTNLAVVPESTLVEIVGIETCVAIGSCAFSTQHTLFGNFGLTVNHHAELRFFRDY